MSQSLKMNLHCVLLYGALFIATTSFSVTNGDQDGSLKICSDEKLDPNTGRLWDAIGDAMHKVRTYINPSGARSKPEALSKVRVVEYTNFNGHEAWAIGMCSNGFTKPDCQQCLTGHIDKIWSQCDNAVNAQKYSDRCGIRYSTSRLTEDNYQDSFP